LQPAAILRTMLSIRAICKAIIKGQILHKHTIIIIIIIIIIMCYNNNFNGDY